MSETFWELEGHIRHSGYFICINHCDTKRASDQDKFEQSIQALTGPCAQETHEINVTDNSFLPQCPGKKMLCDDMILLP